MERHATERQPPAPAVDSPVTEELVRAALGAAAGGASAEVMRAAVGMARAFLATLPDAAREAACGSVEGMRRALADADLLPHLRDTVDVPRRLEARLAAAAGGDDGHVYFVLNPATAGADMRRQGAAPISPGMRKTSSGV